MDSGLTEDDSGAAVTVYKNDPRLTAILGRHDVAVYSGV